MTDAGRGLWVSAGSVMLAVAISSCTLLPDTAPAGSSETAPTGRGTSVQTTSVVTDVVDGDTLRVATPAGRDLGRVRLLGLDAPEIAHDGTGSAECYGTEATQLLAGLAPAGSTVTLRSDPGQPDRDRYGRLLRYVDVAEPIGQGGQGGRGGQVDLTERLLALGAAELYRNEPPLQRADEYAEAAAEAQAGAAGQWGECGP